LNRSKILLKGHTRRFSLNTSLFPAFSVLRLGVFRDELTQGNPTQIASASINFALIRILALARALSLGGRSGARQK
jgi:hypothetical protein